MAKNTKTDRCAALYEAVLDLKDVDEARRFFEDLCSPTELCSIERRFEVARMLLQDKVYTEILQKTGTSSATISRVRRNIIDNGAGGAMKDLILRNGLANNKEGKE